MTKKNLDTTNLPPAIFLMGPTASGKSKIAIEIAKYFPVEIISVDSAQVYRHMDIGTAKPDSATLAEIPHHLIDLIDPDESYSAALFRSSALKIMCEITLRDKIPLLVGGTMLYFRTLQQGLSELPPANKILRTKIDLMAKEQGWPAMHQELHQLDPISAARIKSTDSQRIQRALEICYITNKPMSELLNKPKNANFPYHTTKIALIPSQRTALHKLISQRFDKMISSGLIEEVQSLQTKFSLDANMPAMRCVGYRQAWMFLDQQINLATMHEMGCAATRQLAKRQLTWLRSMRGTELKEFDCLANDLQEQIIRYLQNQMSAMTS